MRPLFLAAVVLAVCTRPPSHIEPDRTPAPVASAVAPVASVSDAGVAEPNLEVRTPVRAPTLTWDHRETHTHASDTYVDVPRLDFGDADVSARVGTAMDTLVAGQRRTFDAARKEFLAEPGAVTDITPLLALSCVVYYASNALVSIGCEQYAFIAGAHGTKSFVPLNLALPDCAPVKLGDLFDPAARWRPTVHALAVRALNHEIDPDDPDAGAGEFTTNAPLDDFVLTTSGPRFSFADSLPFVIGSAAPALVRWRAIDRLLRRGGPADAARSGAPHAEGAPPHDVTDARNDSDARWSRAHPGG